MAITVNSFKFTWRGQWQSSVIYAKNDIVQFNNAAYVCVQTIPDEWKIAQDKTVNATAFYTGSPEIYFADKRPDVETQYWRLIVRGNQFKRGWMPHRVYTYGDIVRYGGDLYMYTGTPGSGASATAIINGQGNVVNVTITSGGTGYAQPPLVTFGFDSLRGSYGAQGYATVSNGVVTGVVITNPGVNYQTAPTIVFNFAPVRNTWPEDPTYWVRIFQNPSRDTRRLYGVALVNQQPLGWTRNYGDFPNPQTNDGNSVGWIGADGVPYSNGWNANATSGTYNPVGRGIRDWVNSWQPSTFTFVDWLRSTDNVSSLGLGGLTSPYLPTPDGLPPRCVQWIRTQWQSAWLFNNGEVYFGGYADANGQAGDSRSSLLTTSFFTNRVTNNGTTGYLGETWPRSFNQTKIIKLDCSGIGSSTGSLTANTSNNTSNSWYAVGSDGSLWVWGYNAYGQLGLGNAVQTGTNAFVSQTQPIRIPAVFFDSKKIVDVMAFGGNYASVIALDEDGDLWGWGSDFSGELGLGGQFSASNYRPIPTRIPFDFRKYGGVKKMNYCQYNSNSNRFVIILTNDGSLFGAGAFPSSTSPQTPTYGAAATNIFVSRFTKYMTTNYNIKQVENVWVVGDAYATNVFIREKDTGLTYGMGDNSRYTIADAAAQYSANAAGSTGPWSLIRGPRNVVMVTMNEADSSGAGGTASLTVMMLDENGRVWGQGLNTRGSLSLGYNGQSQNDITNDQTQNPETGGYYDYWPLRMPSNTRIATIMGQGYTAQDLSSFITDDGQVLYCGSDGTNQNATTGGVQGQINARWYYQNVTTTNSPINRYTMHSLMGD